MTPDDSHEELEHDENEELEGEEFGELIKYTLGGYLGGLVLGGALDLLGASLSGIGQWAVRTLAGEGESIFEGVFALRQRLARRAGGMAEAYGWGKLIGMAFPWAIDALSRAAGVDVNGIPGFYIPYFYALSDQMGANVSGLLFLRRQAGSWRSGLAAYLRHPVMLTSLAVLVLVPVGLLLARVLGFIPSTHVRTAFETIASNLCWLPPLVGWLWERRREEKQVDK